MKKRALMLLMGLSLSFSLFTGCGDSKEATEAANESEVTEKEGQGEETQEETKEETKEEEEPEEETKGKVGILFPSEETDEQWKADADILQKEISSNEYDVEIYFADGDTARQNEQIKELLSSEVSALVIAPVEPYGLEESLMQAKENSVPVFAYDTLIMDTDAVKYYVTFDMRKVGQMIGEKIVKEKELDKAKEDQKTYNIEFLMGAPDESRSLFLYNGIMEVLQSYFDDGTLVSLSQKTSFDDTAVMRWSEETAKQKIEDILGESYQNGQSLDIVCTASDKFANAVFESLTERGMVSEAGEVPYITGLGSEAEVIKKVAAGEVGFTMFLDRRTLAEDCAKMVITYLSGNKPEVTDYEQYDNGKKIIGTYTSDAELIDKDNYEMLVDNGYYTEEQLAPEPTEEPKVTEEPEVTEKPEPTGTTETNKKRTLLNKVN